MDRSPSLRCRHRILLAAASWQGSRNSLQLFLLGEKEVLVLTPGGKDDGGKLELGNWVSRLELGLGLLVPRLRRIVGTGGRHRCSDLPVFDGSRITTFVGASVMKDSSRSPMDRGTRRLKAGMHRPSSPLMGSGRQYAPRWGLERPKIPLVTEARAAIINRGG